MHSISQTTHRGVPLLWPALAHSPQQAPAHWPLFPTPSRFERGRADARTLGGPGCGRESHSGRVTGSMRGRGGPTGKDSDRRQGRRKATSFGHCTSQAAMSNDAPLHPLLFQAPFVALFASASLPICTPHALCPCEPFRLSRRCLAFPTEA